MIITLFHYLKGFLELRVCGMCLERFINLCVRRGIYLWKIRKKGDTEATVCVSIPGFFRMREAAQKTKTRVHIVRRRGLPLFLHRHRKRSAFYFGILLFALVLFILSSFVWSIEIDGLEKMDENLIRNALSTCGLETGVLKYKVKASEIKAEMLRMTPALDWLWVEMRGTRAFVHVREKTPKPSIVSLGRPANIVAKKDGVIERITASRGTPLYKEGDAVKKGALLISGTVETKHGGTLFVHAEGTAVARTWQTVTDTFPLKKTEETETGRKRTHIDLCFGSFSLPLHGKTLPFESFRTESETHTLRLFGASGLSIGFTKTTLYETNAREVPLSPSEAEAFFGEKLLARMTLPEDGQTINVTYSHTLCGDGNIEVSCTAECIEEIGETREILEETKDDGTIF